MRASLIGMVLRCCWGSSGAGTTTLSLHALRWPYAGPTLHEIMPKNGPSLFLLFNLLQICAEEAVRCGAVLSVVFFTFTF